MADLRIVGRIVTKEATKTKHQIEVAIWSDRGQSDLIYVSGYRYGQVSERSIGMTVAAARELAAVLTRITEHEGHG